MHIVHIAPNAPYNDYWGYQENLLPKYQKKLGHNVTVITTNQKHSDGKIVDTEEADYQLIDGVRIIRRKRKEFAFSIITSLCARIPVIELLEELKPDFIFFHGLVSTTIFDAISYKRKTNPKCVIVQDNHMDYYNARSTSDLKGKMIRSFYRFVARRSIPNVDRVYGVTPWREQFARDYFKIPAEKTDVLIMGADDEQIDLNHKMIIRQKIREQYHVSENDYLIVTGGKIDESKNTHLLMAAINQLQGVRLIVFGEVTQNIQQQILEQISEKIDLVGWIPAERTYDYFMAADLICFPGTHSVMWEQACACKVPCLFKRWDGMEHVDNGGNSAFIDNVSVEGIQAKIKELVHTEIYDRMKMVAKSEKTDIYLYSQIAKKSLEAVEDLQNPC